jgi:hypothetical protein
MTSCCGQTVGDRSCNAHVNLLRSLSATLLAWVIGRIPGVSFWFWSYLVSFGTEGALAAVATMCSMYYASAAIP